MAPPPPPPPPPPRVFSLSLFFFLLLLLSPLQANGIGIGTLGQWRILVSLSHSLLNRVANVRSDRGDLSGADRARKMADKIQFVGGRGGIWSMGWDYLRNYAWRGGVGIPTAEISRAANDLLSLLHELGGMEWDGGKARWVLRNYPKLRSLSNSLLTALLQAFSQSGPLREALLILQREVGEGELVRDCLEVGAKDLEGIIRIAKDVFFSRDADYRDL